MVKDNLFLAKNRKKARKMGYILLFDYEYVQNNKILNLIGILLATHQHSILFIWNRNYHLDIQAHQETLLQRQ